MDINLFPQIYINIITFCYIYKLSEPGFHAHTMYPICGLMKWGLNFESEVMGFSASSLP